MRSPIRSRSASPAFSGQMMKRFSRKAPDRLDGIGVRLIESGGEGAQARLDASSAGADRFLESRARKRQRFRCGERAEHRSRK